MQAKDPEVVYSDDKITVESMRITGRDGREHPRTVVRHPDVVAILPLLDDGRVVLIENHRWPLGRKLIELPAGCMEPGESPLDAAHRELAEETGYRAREMAPLFGFYPAPGLLDERVEVFVATGLERGEQELDPTEQLNTMVWSMPDLLAAIHDGKIEEVRTIATVLRWLSKPPIPR